MAVDKLTAFYRQSQAIDTKKVAGEDNLLVRVQLERLCTSIDDYRCSYGSSSEYDAFDLNEVVPIIKYKYQTMASYGVAKATLTDFVLNNHLIGIDRIVPLGETTSFSLTWDGYDLISALSRLIVVGQILSYDMVYPKFVETKNTFFDSEMSAFSLLLCGIYTRELAEEAKEIIESWQGGNLSVEQKRIIEFLEDTEMNEPKWESVIISNAV